jgi:hypothetical protein
MGDVLRQARTAILPQQADEQDAMDGAYGVENAMWERFEMCIDS